MTERKPKNKKTVKPEDIKPVEKKLKDGPLASDEAGRKPKTEEPVVVLKPEEKVADETAEAKMFKEVQENAKARGKKAEMDPITGTIIIR